MKTPDPQYCVDCKRYCRGNNPKLDACTKDGRLCMAKRGNFGFRNESVTCKDYR